MTTVEAKKVAWRKLSLLTLIEELGHVSKTCRIGRCRRFPVLIVTVSTAHVEVGGIPWARPMGSPPTSLDATAESEASGNLCPCGAAAKLRSCKT